MKVIIAGSRDITSGQFLKSIELFPDEWNVTEVVSGTARGVDQMGEVLARVEGIPIKQFPADWDNLGKCAGHLRNKDMAIYADALFCVWDGKSKGTKNMFAIATELGLNVRVVKINKGKCYIHFDVRK